ncbi:MAG: sortase [Bacilli bacterium]|nr:sortase [Bacilli bacterium]
MLISFSDNTNAVEEYDTPISNEVVSMDKKKKPKKVEYKPIDYSIYLGVLRIPKISLKRGFFNTTSKYNNIQYNVTLIKGSDMPNVKHGNLVLIAQSGDAWISYFANLYKLKVGDKAYIDYKGNTYKYTIKKIYTVPKNGYVSIIRNYKKTTLTLITCTKGSDKKQTVYICESD